MREPFTNYYNSVPNIFKPWSEKSSCSEAEGLGDLLSIGQSNAKAFADIAKTVCNGTQAVVTRQTEILQRNTEDAAKFFRELSSSARSPEDSLEKQSNFAKNAISSAIANSREILEITSKCQNEAGEIIRKRVANAFSELSPEKSNTEQPAKESKKRSEAQ